MLLELLTFLAGLQIPLFPAVGSVVGLLALLYNIHRGVASDQDTLDQMFTRVVPRRIQDDGTLFREFFTGTDVDHNCLNYVALKLDADRPSLLDASTAAPREP